MQPIIDKLLQEETTSKCFAIRAVAASVTNHVTCNPSYCCDSSGIFQTSRYIYAPMGYQADSIIYASKNVCQNSLIARSQNQGQEQGADRTKSVKLMSNGFHPSSSSINAYLLCRYLEYRQSELHESENRCMQARQRYLGSTPHTLLMDMGFSHVTTSSISTTQGEVLLQHTAREFYGINGASYLMIYKGNFHYSSPFQ